MVALAALCFVLAVVLLAWVVLAYDTDEKAADDVLINWWVAADDASKSRRLHTSTIAVASWFADLFGARVFAPNAFAVSFCLSTSSTVLFLCLGLSVFWQLAAGEASAVAISLSLVTAAAGIAVSIASYSAAISIARGRQVNQSIREYAVISAGLLIVLLIVRPTLALEIASFALSWLLLGVIAHYVPVTVGRSLFTWAANRSVAHIVAANVTYALVGTLMFALPFIGIASRPNAPWVKPLFFVGASSLFTLASGVAAFTASLLLLLSRALWPVFARLLYNAHRFGILRRRKLLFYAATGLLGVGAPTVAKHLMNGAGPFMK